MADIKNTLNVFNEFKNAFEQNQLDKSKNLFEQLKLALTQFGYPTNDINAEEQTKRLFLCSMFVFSCKLTLIKGRFWSTGYC